MEKEFKSYKEQLRLLKSKGMEIPDEDHAIAVLKNISYFALINGYKSPFKDKNGNYLKSTKFEDIEQLYLFDEKLRIFMLEQLLSIERKVKSSISYHFSKQFRDPNAYFNVNHFDYTGEKIEKINELVSILKDIHNDNKRSYIIHYKKNHGDNIPLWVLINAMTFGRVSKMYSLLQEGTQQKISEDFKIASQKDLGQMLNMLTLFRNVCAHNERLYDYNIRSGISGKYINFPTPSREAQAFDKERKGLFGVLICCKCLMTEPERHELFDKFEILVYDAEIMKKEKLNEILLSEMGLPRDRAVFRGFR